MKRQIAFFEANVHDGKDFARICSIFAKFGVVFVWGDKGVNSCNHFKYRKR